MERRPGTQFDPYRNSGQVSGSSPSSGYGHNERHGKGNYGTQVHKGLNVKA